MNFSINYDSKELSIHWDGQKFSFDLNEGDIGDYWHSFQHQGATYDLNYHQEDEMQEPSVSVYPVVFNKYGDFGPDTMNGDELNLKQKIGNPKNYFV